MKSFSSQTNVDILHLVLGISLSSSTSYPTDFFLSICYLRYLKSFRICFQFVFASCSCSSSAFQIYLAEVQSNRQTRTEEKNFFLANFVAQCWT